jgi:hypothetical protein
MFYAKNQSAWLYWYDYIRARCHAYIFWTAIKLVRYITLKMIFITFDSFKTTKNKLKVYIYSVFLNTRKNITLEDSSLRPLVLLTTSILRWRRVWSISGMILTGKNRSTRRKIWSNSTLSAINLTWTSPGSIRASAMRGRGLKAWALARPHSPFLKTKISMQYIYKSNSYFTLKTLRLHYKNQSVKI